MGMVENASPALDEKTAVAEAESALIALGYKPQEATRMVAAVKADGMSSEELIRAALKNAVKI